MTSTASLEHELLVLPQDGITAAKFSHHSNHVLVSSWDKGVRLYEAVSNQHLYKYEHKAAVLDCCFSADDTKGFSGGLDCTLTMTDFKAGSEVGLGNHEHAIKCVSYSGASNLVVTGSWDRTVKLWDPRAHKPIVGSYDQPGKVHSLDVAHHTLVVASHPRHVYLYDTRQMQEPVQRRESSLMHHTRCVRMFPDAKGYALGSIEGRVAIEYVDASPSVQARKYAFKCHRKVKDGTQMLYPVNAIAFHPIHGTFATGGCDGLINVWDGENKKRICQYPAYPTSIASLCFNSAGNLLAIAASYTFESGERDHPSDTVFIRTINDNEVKPKHKR